MSQYGGNGSAVVNNGQPQQLTSLSNLPIHQYQHDSPGPPPLLPPIGQSQSSPYASQMYRGGSGAGNGASSNSYQPIRHSDSSQHLGQHSNFAHLQPQPPQTYSFQHQQHALPAYSSAQSAGFYNHTAPPTNGGLMGPASYGPVSLPNLSATLPGYGGGGSTQSLPPPPQQQQQQQQQPLPSFSTRQPPPTTLQQSEMNNDARMMVVGSQGKRGILPSVTGQQAPAAATAAAAPSATTEGPLRGPLNVQKNAEGKFPCLYCTKTYQHLKHLKRHLLRHTGERPYSCYLCEETFCRSDILKRHFQKCSQRRGNPTGANHLTYAQMHRRPANQQPSVPSPSGQKPHGSAPAQPTWQGPSPNAAPFAPSQAHLPSALKVDSNRSSRSSSVLRPGSAGSDDHRKRYSGSNSHTSVSTGLDTSPSNGMQQDHKGNALQLARDRFGAAQQHQHQQQQHPSHHQQQQQHMQHQQHQAQQPQQPHSHFADQSAPNWFNQQSVPPLSLATQAENSPSIMYAARNGNFQQYQNGHAVNGEHDGWSNYFQPGGNNIMFSS